MLVLGLLIPSCAPGGEPELDAEHNRLIFEKSPYLLQHADNPVDWYPWGPEAFEKAMAQISKVITDTAYAHVAADHLLCAALRRLGFEAGVEIFENMDKWYE